MRILIDTHIFIWWDIELNRLSPSAREYLNDPRNTILVSAASIWEMQIKLAIGKLTLRLPLAELVREQREKNGFNILHVTLGHVLRLEGMPMHHRDPFDRLLIAQAQSENLALLSADTVFQNYQVDLLS